MRSSHKMFVSADKTQNYYEIIKENYKNILHDPAKSSNIDNKMDVWMFFNY